MAKAQRAVNQSSINQRNLAVTIIPVAPLPEQRRIVAKVDELMALCDSLEVEREKREATRDRLTTASLSRLTAPDVDEKQFKAHADFAIRVLPELTSRADQIKVLRQTILDLAVRGKLVEQDPNDEAAKKVLSRIRRERDSLIRCGKIKGGNVDSVKPSETPFVVPASWCWTRLGAVGDWRSGSTPSRGNPGLYGGGITWLKSGELNDNRQLSGSEETVTQAAIEGGSFRMNRPGDVLIAMYGATIGKLAILAETAVTNQAVCGCTPFAGVSNRFLFLFLLSQREAIRRASEGGAQPNISKAKIVNMQFPLPPLPEQNRIVVKVNRLTALCDQFEQQLCFRDEAQSHTLEAVLQMALEPAVVEAA